MNWVVWNKELKSIVDYGAESEMNRRADELNERYQSNAYKAKEFKP